MKHIIVGGGPSGLCLAFYLSQKIHSLEEILLIEKDIQLGGSWNSQWIDDKYWSENSPRVFSYSKYTKQFMDDIGIKRNDLETIYGDTILTNIKVVNFVIGHFHLKDYFIFLKGFIKYRFLKNKNSNRTILLQDWLNSSGLSEKAKTALTIISITICDRPDKTNINDFFYSIGVLESYTQFKNPNKWHRLAENYLLKNRNISILKNHEVIGLFDNNTGNKITGLEYINRKTKQKTHIQDDIKVYLCTQSSGILSILRKSSPRIKNNWFRYNIMEKWCKGTHYNGFGFQIHFKKKRDFPEKWCWSCFGDWNIIILPVSNWLTEFTKDKSIKTVWSCCIVDMDTISKRINKSANNCDTKAEVLEECLSQLDLSIGRENKELIVTTSIGLTKYKGKWSSKNTGFTQTNLGTLPFRGTKNNLYAIGCFSNRENPSIAYMETAVDSVFRFLGKEKKRINKEVTVISITILLVIIVVLVINYKFM